MKEFRVNNYLTLKLENNKTFIFVGGERFQQCKYLLIDISIEEVESFEEIKSIDEVSEKLDRSLEKPTREDVKIKPEVEFWGHCSNLQVWYERNYDTSLLHSNLAFPLLKKLTEVGDPLARKKFKEEIAKKLTDGSNPVALYLYGRNYVKYLSREEFWSLFGSDGEVLHKIEQRLKKFQLINGKKYYKQNIDEFEYFKLSKSLEPELGPTIFNVENGKVTGISIHGDEKFIAEDNNNLYSEDLGNLELEELPESLGELLSLNKLALINIGLKKIPKSIKNLKNLEELSIASNPQFNIPEVLWNIGSLKKLNLSNNNLKIIPESIERLENLQELSLYGNCMESLPIKAIDKLNKLRTINLEGEKYLSKLDDETIEWLRNY